MKRKVKVVDSFMGSGKALKNGSKLITESGFVNIEDSKVGDKIFCEDGELHEILGVYPQGVKNMYKITFNDGTHVLCSKDHLWTVSNPEWCTEKTLTTEELIEKKLYRETKKRGRKWLIKIPMNKPLQFKESKTKIHPYVIGVLLGDGGLSGSSVHLTNSEKDIVDNVDRLIGEDFSVLPARKNVKNIEYIIVQNDRKSNEKNKFKSYLKELGLMGCKSVDKHIPHKYLFNSIENRIELLRGLVDTDGYISEDNKIDYISKSKRLIEDIQFLVESLGGTATLNTKTVEPYGEYYRLYICLPTSITPYSSKKNMNKKFSKQQFEPYRKIRSIEKAEACECTCIRVDNPTKLFLTDHCIVTHNTQAAIAYINRLDESKRVLFVTPFLSECERVIEGCPFSQFKQPSEDMYGTKGRHFKHLLRCNNNIACTHALFSYIDDEILSILRDREYILILDEVMDVVNHYDLHQGVQEEMTNAEKKECIISDMESLIANKYIYIQDDFSVRWSDDENMRLKYYDRMRELSDRHLLYYVNNSVLFWIFPSEVFEDDIFDDIFILTYLFDCQIQFSYYKYYGIPVQYYHIEEINGIKKFVLTENRQHDKQKKLAVKKLITIVEKDSLNNIGRSYTSTNGGEVYTTLSKGWYIRNAGNLKEVGRCLFNFLRHAPAEERMYTTFKDYNKRTRHDRIGVSAFVPLNSKATNAYSDRTHCAYLINRYINPYIVAFFRSKGVSVDQDKFALSEMIQWIWRSAIRNDEPIKVYIPSHRMRTLFKQWLDDKPIQYEQFESKYFSGKHKKSR